MKRRVSYPAFRFIVILVFALCHFDAFAQRRSSSGRPRAICDYHVPARSRPHALKFGSVAEAEAAVDRLLKVVGLTRNFVIEASYDVDNAESGIDGNNRRYIYYNPAFMDRIKNKARTDWAALAIMAHEIGHHLLGHRTEDGGKTPQEEEELRHRQELEADKYSGFLLRYLGASVSEAQSAVEAYGDEDGSPTHPPMGARLDAIRGGWEAATGLIKGWVAAEERQIARPRPQHTPTITTIPELLRERSVPASPRISARNTATRLSQSRWAWTVFIDAPPEVLEQVSCVVYQLHPTFSPSVVRVCEPGDREAFALNAEGWGIFKIQIHVIMKDRRRYDLAHALRL